MNLPRYYILNVYAVLCRLVLCAYASRNCVVYIRIGNHVSFSPRALSTYLLIHQVNRFCLEFEMHILHSLNDCHDAKVVEQISPVHLKTIRHKSF